MSGVFVGELQAANRKIVPTNNKISDTCYDIVTRNICLEFIYYLFCSKTNFRQVAESDCCYYYGQLGDDCITLMANEAKAEDKCGVEDEHIFENAHNLKPFCLKSYYFNNNKYLIIFVFCHYSILIHSYLVLDEF